MSEGEAGGPEEISEGTPSGANEPRGKVVNDEPRRTYAFATDRHIEELTSLRLRLQDELDSCKSEIRRLQKTDNELARLRERITWLEGKLSGRRIVDGIALTLNAVGGILVGVPGERLADYGIPGDVPAKALGTILLISGGAVLVVDFIYKSPPKSDP